VGRGALCITAMVDLLKPVRSLPMEVGVHSTVLGGPGGQGAVDYQAGACMYTPILVQGEVPSPSSGRYPTVGVALEGSMRNCRILLQMSQEILLHNSGRLLEAFPVTVVLVGKDNVDLAKMEIGPTSGFRMQ
jgi:hypothetical protein